MHSNLPLHLYSVYLLYIYTYRRYTSIYTYIYGTSVRCQKHFDLRRLSPNYSLCIFNSAFSVHLSVSPPLAPPPSHSVPCNPISMCVLLVVGRVCFRFCCDAMRCGCIFVVRFGLFSNWEIRFLVFLLYL